MYFQNTVVFSCQDRIRCREEVFVLFVIVIVGRGVLGSRYY